jgi:hypothetical protein
MTRSLTRPMIIAGALSLMGMGTAGMVPGETSKAEAAQWLAPAPHQELAAKWVEDVARELRQPQFRNVLMNVPFGTPQATILDLLNEAALGLENGYPRYALDLVRQAVEVLDDTTRGQRWLSPSEVQPIQAMILKKAKQAFDEAGHQWKNQQLQTRTSQRSQRQDGQQRMKGGERLFNPDRPNQPLPRYEDYTSEHWQSGYNPRTGERTRDRGFQRDRERDMNLRSQNIRDRGQMRMQRDSQRMRQPDRNRRDFTQDRYGDVRRMRDFDRGADRAEFGRGFEDNRRFYDDRGFRGANRQ